MVGKIIDSFSISCPCNNEKDNKGQKHKKRQNAVDYCKADNKRGFHTCCFDVMRCLHCHVGDIKDCFIENCETSEFDWKLIMLESTVERIVNNR